MKNILNAKYHQVDDGDKFISATIDGIEVSVPIDPANRHYDLIMQEVDAGALTIEPQYTEQELDQMEADAAAEAKLEALGLTKEDLAALLGS